VRGAESSAAEMVDMIRERTRLVRAMDDQVANLDALVLPTTAIVAPTIAEMQDPGVFTTKNVLLLRNTLIWNFFDMCAISLPLPRSGLPVGLMLIARNGQDRKLFRMAAAVERLFAA
jgi:aspartyl-tRNA(Asn)/glutamyl-tRNA(Gln) amidotransferase subunit A